MYWTSNSNLYRPNLLGNQRCWCMLVSFFGYAIHENMATGSLQSLVRITRSKNGMPICSGVISVYFMRRQQISHHQRKKNGQWQILHCKKRHFEMKQWLHHLSQSRLYDLCYGNGIFNANITWLDNLHIRETIHVWHVDEWNCISLCLQDQNYLTELGSAINTKITLEVVFLNMQIYS